jgi:hypothetical protein
VRVLDQRAQRATLVGRVGRQQIDDGLAVDDPRRRVQSIDAAVDGPTGRVGTRRPPLVKR